MNKNKLLAVMLFLTSHAIVAQDNSAPDQLFVGLKGGYHVLDDDNIHSKYPDGMSVGVYGGLRFDHNLSWDLGYTTWDAVETDSNTISVDIIESALRYDAYINQNVSLYNRFGVGYALSRGGRDGFSPMGELGINYKLNDSISTGLSYQYVHAVGGHDSVDIDAHSFNWSLTYSFANPFRNEAVEVVKQEAEPKVAPVTEIELKDSTQFCFDCVELTAGEKRRLLNLIHRIPEQSDAVFNIVGYSDSLGSKEYNMHLSILRAQSVKNFLVNVGARESQITVTGKGEAQPIASNKTQQGRRRNRRVEIKVNYTLEDKEV